MDECSTKPCDKRLKENIKPLDNTALFHKLNPVKFNIRVDVKEPQTTHYGFIAQELANSYPELVRVDRDKEQPEVYVLTVDYTSFIALLVKKVQEQDRQIEDLTKAVLGNRDGLIESQVDTNEAKNHL